MNHESQWSIQESYWLPWESTWLLMRVNVTLTPMRVNMTHESQCNSLWESIWLLVRVNVTPHESQCDSSWESWMLNTFLRVIWLPFGFQWRSMLNFRTEFSRKYQVLLNLCNKKDQTSQLFYYIYVLPKVWKFKSLPRLFLKNTTLAAVAIWKV